MPPSNIGELKPLVSVYVIRLLIINRGIPKRNLIKCVIEIYRHFEIFPGNLPRVYWIDAIKKISFSLTYTEKDFHLPCLNFWEMSSGWSDSWQLDESILEWHIRNWRLNCFASLLLEAPNIYILNIRNGETPSYIKLHVIVRQVSSIENMLVYFSSQDDCTDFVT